MADITRALSDAGINIANMNLCRARRGGDALTVIETDQPIPAPVRREIGTLRGVLGVTCYEKEED